MASQSCIDLQQVCGFIILFIWHMSVQEEREVLQSIYEGDDAFKTLTEASFSYRVSF